MITGTGRNNFSTPLTSQTTQQSLPVENNVGTSQTERVFSNTTRDGIERHSHPGQLIEHNAHSIQQAALDPTHTGPALAIDFGLQLAADNPLGQVLPKVGMQLLREGVSQAEATQILQRLARSPVHALSEEDYQLLRKVPADDASALVRRSLLQAERTLIARGLGSQHSTWFSTIADKLELYGMNALDVLAASRLTSSIEQFDGPVTIKAPDVPENPDGSIRMRLYWEMDPGSQVDSFVLHYGLTSRGSAESFTYDHQLDMGLPPLVNDDGEQSYMYDVSEILGSSEFLGRQVHLAIIAKNGVLQSDLSEELSGYFNLQRDDVDGRGQVDLADVAYLLELLNGSAPIDWDNNGRSDTQVDVNRDGTIDRKDLTALLQHVCRRE